MFYVVGLLLAILSSAERAIAQEDEYSRELSELLETSGALETADIIMVQLIPALKQITVKDAPLGFWDEFQRKWNRETREKLVEFYVPIYKKYLSLEDLKKIVVFYDTPAGKRLAAANPSITRDGMQAGQQLGMEIAAQMMREMEQLGCR